MKITDKHKVEFDYLVEDKPIDTAAAAATNASNNYFKGSRIDLVDYLNLVNPELYNKVFIYTVNGNTRNWFSSLSSDFISTALKNNGFTWENETISLVLKDNKKN